MNIFTKFCYLTLALLALIGENKAQDLTLLHLDESIHYALENNVAIKNAFLEIRASKATVGETTSQGFPQIQPMWMSTRTLLFPLNLFLLSSLIRKHPKENFIPVQFFPLNITFQYDDNR